MHRLPHVAGCEAESRVESPESRVDPNGAKSICRTGLQARLFKYEIVLDLVSADLTKCEIFKQPQKDIYAL